MMVKELIAALAQESDMTSSVYVRAKDGSGNIIFIAVEGIAISSESYRAFNDAKFECTTLLLDT